MYYTKGYDIKYSTFINICMYYAYYQYFIFVFLIKMLYL